jgi:hypothetical protein
MASISKRLRCPVLAGEELAKQVGHVRLQCSLTSISARQLCCSWSGTEAAIVGAALVDPGMEFERHIAWFEEIAAALPIARLARYERLLDAVLGAALEVIDRAPFLDDLRRHQTHAGLAERGGLAEKDVGPGLAGRGDQVRRG